jgi:hypothetical protein
MDDSLKKAEHALRQLHQVILELSNEQKKEELIAKAVQLNFHQETGIMNLLEKTNKAYDLLVQENFDLLINHHIIFTVSHEDTVIHPSHALILDGKIGNDDLFHAHSVESNSSFLQFYPVAYSGLVNYFAEAELYLNRKKTTFVGIKIPLQFVGTINPQGGLQIEAQELASPEPGKKYVSHIIADLFSGNQVRKQKFFDNKALLKNIIADYRNQL